MLMCLCMPLMPSNICSDVQSPRPACQHTRCILQVDAGVSASAGLRRSRGSA